MADVLNLVGISGSLRKGSYNSAMLRALPELAPPGLRIAIHSIADIPLYNGDVEVEQGIPAPVGALHRAIRASDGVIICTPEYNHSVPGVLKNAIDWLSRGPMPHAFYEVPSAILGGSDGMFGTTRGQYVLRQTLVTLNSPCMHAPQVLVQQIDKKVDEHHVLVDQKTRDFLKGYLVAVEKWMRRFPRAEREHA